MDIEPLELAAWRLAVDGLPSEDLPTLAVDALVRGVDGPALRLLAGQAPGDVRESRDLFDRALDELGIAMPTEQEALWKLVRLTCAQIASGAVAPFVGAAWIWRSASWRVEDEGDLRIFAGLASEYEDHPDDAVHIGAQIVAESKELLGRTDPRRWVTLMAARGTSPLSRTGPSGDEPIELVDLTISPPLAARIAAWVADYEQTFGDRDEDDGFESEADADSFTERGRSLVDGIQKELGPRWYVDYMPEPTRPPGVRLKSDL